MIRTSCRRLIGVVTGAAMLLLVATGANAQLSARERMLINAAKKHDAPVAPDSKNAPQQKLEPLTERQVAFHVLNRLSFGPQPGQVDKLMSMGWQKWVKAQLKPHKIDESPQLIKQLYELTPSMFMTIDQVFVAYRPSREPGESKYDYGIRLNRLRGLVATELRRAVVLSAMQSNRRLAEVLYEFWRNHFNIFYSKGEVSYMANDYENSVIRQHTFGRFENMLIASAKHPAMLLYLDNAISQKPLTDSERRKVERYEGRRRVPVSIAALSRQRGLNENYARELMELHTLGVDDGYSQHDVIEVARMLTGWSIGHSKPNGTYGFVFRPEVHDDGTKLILGTRLPRNRGLDEGEWLLGELAASSTTAKFISYKLCRYLVNDQPPKALVKRVARVFRRTGGDLPSVYKAILFSPEFIDRLNFRAKFKTPFEYVVSALRATDAKVNNIDVVLQSVARMGQPVYGMEDPTGYHDQAEAWLDPGVLAFRWHFAMQLARGNLPGISIKNPYMNKIMSLSREQMKNELVTQLLPGGIDPRTDKLLGKQSNRFGGGNDSVLALLLGSPVFQQQ